jgi:hypothetical protein
MASDQIRQMVNFILQEAHEKANEIRVKVRVPFRPVRIDPPWGSIGEDRERSLEMDSVLESFCFEENAVQSGQRRSPLRRFVQEGNFSSVVEHARGCPLARESSLPDLSSTLEHWAPLHGSFSRIVRKSHVRCFPFFNVNAR